MTVTEILLQEVAADLQARMVAALHSFKVQYHSASEAQWQLACVEVAHLFGFDAQGRYRRALKVVIRDGRLGITDSCVPLRLPFNMIMEWELCDPGFCVGRVFAELLSILKRQNEVMY